MSPLAVRLHVLQPGEPLPADMPAADYDFAYLAEGCAEAAAPLGAACFALCGGEVRLTGIYLEHSDAGLLDGLLRAGFFKAARMGASRAVLPEGCGLSFPLEFADTHLHAGECIQLAGLFAPHCG